MSAVKQERRPEAPFVPPNARHLTGHCRVAAEMEHKDGPGAGDRFHKRCHGAYLLPLGKVNRCACLCHTGDEEPLDTDAEIRAARLARELRSLPPQMTRPPELAGVVKPAGQSAGPVKDKCSHGHAMTPENTGPRGVCRACKRDASKRAKDKKAKLRGAK
jgi:hypothetical protein